MVFLGGKMEQVPFIGCLKEKALDDEPETQENLGKLKDETDGGGVMRQ